MAGISSKAANGAENRYKFNGGTELNNDLDISTYETLLFDHVKRSDMSKLQMIGICNPDIVKESEILSHWQFGMRFALTSTNSLEHVAELVGNGLFI